MPESNDIDWFKQTLRATFPYVVFIVVFILGTVAIMVWAAHAEEVGKPVLLPQAHSHNDYYRENPLEDALSLGFCSVEADIYLIDGALLVAHDRDKVSPEKTLSAMYLQPLFARFQRFGSVYPEAAPFQLLIDIKSEGEGTFTALQQELEAFETMLTRFDAEKTIPGAVTVVISGNRAIDAILGAKPRLAGVDGRLSDLDGAYTAHQMPLISDNWTKHFRWRGKGEIPKAEGEKLRAIVAQTHAKGMRLRFWATPQRDDVWSTLHAAGVDVLNADDLQALHDVLHRAAAANSGR